MSKLIVFTENFVSCTTFGRIVVLVYLYLCMAPGKESVHWYIEAGMSNISGIRECHNGICNNLIIVFGGVKGERGAQTY